MLSHKAVRELMNILKGRISKVLSRTKEVPPAEIYCLHEVFNTIDSIILSNKKLTTSKIKKYKKSLKESLFLIQDSEKTYIKKHIVPTLESVIEEEWSLWVKLVL